MAEHSEILAALLDRHGETFAHQAGIRLADTPSPLFGLLTLSSLLSANISAQLGIRAARAFQDAGIRTAHAMVGAGDDQRWQVLADAQYLRKRQTARQLGTLADQVVDTWHGDLRRLRDQAHGRPDRIRELLQDFTGVGPVGSDIFCREVQRVWPSLRPWCDERMSQAAQALGLPADAAGLALLAGTGDLSQLGAALVSSALDRDAEVVLEVAG